jgi:hypothetical protein
MDIVTIIKDVGFPVAMCIYLLAIQNKTISGNTNAINRLLDHLQKKEVKKDA